MKKKITITLDETTIERLRKEAAITGKSRFVVNQSSIIEQALQHYWKEKQGGN